MASSCTCTPKFYQRLGREIMVLEFAWTADTDGSFTAVSTDDFTFGTRTLTKLIISKFLFGGKTIPGATTPTDKYDVSIVDGDNEDVFSKVLYNRSSSMTQSEKITKAIEGALTIDILNNSTVSATGTLKLYFY